MSIMCKQEEKNNNEQSPTPALPRRKQNRMKRRMSTLLHTHVALIVLTICAVLDAGCVIGQIISDILIMKDELHEKEILEQSSKDIMFKTFPDVLNKTIHNNWSLQSILVEVQTSHVHNGVHSHRPFDKVVGGLSNLHKPWENGTDKDDGSRNHVDHFHRHRRAAGGNHRHDLLTDAAKHQHYMLHELTHAFHLGSMVILTLLVLITFFKIFVMGKKFLHHKIEVFDAFVITVSWALDLVFWEGLWAHPENEAANIMIFILPWRVIRIVNSFVLVIQGRDLLQLKIVKQQYRGSMKRANDLKMKVELYRVEIKNLNSLCKKRGATEKDIQSCAPTGGRRRRSSLLPILGRLASLGLSVNSTTDLLKSSHEPPTPAESDSDDDSAIGPSLSCSRQSSTSEDFPFNRHRKISSVSDDYSLSRTISNTSGTTFSTIPVTPRESVASSVFHHRESLASLGEMVGEENSAFEDDETGATNVGHGESNFTKM